MTDKIKSAREWHKDGTLLYTLKHAGWKNGVEQFQNETTIKVEGDNAEAVAETILKALSALERLQGVDGMKKKICDKDPIECWRIVCHMPRDCADKKFNMGYNQAIDDVKAKLIADIGGDG